MKLYKLKYDNGSELFFAAQDFLRVCEVYDNVKSMEKIDDKVFMLRDRDGSDQYIDNEWTKADSRFPVKEGENLINYIQRLCRHIVDVECSNRGYQSVFDRLKEDNKATQ
jgi:hypothetical protein